MADTKQPRVKIPGGCPDGFWSLENCNYAVALGTCTLIEKIDRRVVKTENGIATVAAPQAAGGAS